MPLKQVSGEQEQLLERANGVRKIMRGGEWFWKGRKREKIDWKREKWVRKRENVEWEKVTIVRIRETNGKIRKVEGKQ